MIICSSVSELGYEKTLISICKNIILYDKMRLSKKRKSRERINRSKYSFLLKSIRRKIEEGYMTGNCMAISLFFFWLLELNGYTPRLINGVRLMDDRIEAHMWVECGNIKINYLPTKEFIKIREVTLYDIVSEWIEGIV